MTEQLSPDQVLPEIRQLPEVEPRVETGPIVFGTDWPGTFIRGDNAAYYAMHLHILIQAAEKRGAQEPYEYLSSAVVRGLLSDLESSSLVKR